MKKPVSLTLTLRLGPKDTQQLTHLANATGMNTTAAIRAMMRLGFAAVVNDTLSLNTLVSDIDLAAKEQVIKREAEQRIAALRNLKPAKAQVHK